MTLQPLLALDLGATKVACVVGMPRENAQGFELLGSSLIAYPTSSEAWLSDPLLMSRVIEHAVEAAAVPHEFHRAIIGIHPTSLSSEHVRVSIPLADEPIGVRTQDLKRLEAGALHQALAIDREPLLVERLGCSGNGFDGVPDPRGLPASRLAGTFHIVAMPVASRRAVLQAVESAGLEIAQLRYTLPATLASGAEDAGRSRLLLIDVGGLTTDIGWFVDGVLRAVELRPWGGWRMAETIAKTLKVTMDQAITWSLEGKKCRKPEVRELLESEWALLRQSIDKVLAGQPKPDLVLVGGRGALIDGFAEWVERSTGVRTALCRSPRTNQLGDVSRQIGLSSAIGLLELATRTAPGPSLGSPKLFNRLIDRTRLILTDYF